MKTMGGKKVEERRRLISLKEIFIFIKLLFNLLTFLVLTSHLQTLLLSFPYISIYSLSVFVRRKNDLIHDRLDRADGRKGKKMRSGNFFLFPNLVYDQQFVNPKSTLAHSLVFIPTSSLISSSQVEDAVRISGHEKSR